MELSTPMPQRVLIVSKDQTLLEAGAASGDALLRHRYYAERLRADWPGSEIRIVAFSPSTAPAQTNPAAGLRIYGTASRHRACFLPDAWKVLRVALAGPWRPTVVTTQEPYEQGPLGLWVARRCGARFIPQIHFDLFAPEWRQESRLNGVRRLICEWILRRADAVRVVSSLQKRQLVQRLSLAAESVHVVPVGVSFVPSTLDQRRCQKQLSPRLVGRPTVLFVGRFYPPKNLGLWVEVAQRILAQNPDTMFVLAGDGPQLPEVREMVRGRGLEASCIFTGSISYDRISEVYGAADLLLLTSHYETFGRVLVEAQLAGIPVVSTRSGGPEDIVTDGENGYLRPCGDAAGLAEAAVSLLLDAEKRHRFGACGRIQATRKFSREQLADDLVRLWIDG